MVHESHLEKHWIKAHVHPLLKTNKQKKSALSLHPELYLVYLDFISELAGKKNRADFLNECDLA